MTLKKKNYCCENMTYHLDKFKELVNPNDPDVIIVYSAKFDEYGIPIKDGGNSYIEIQYCPWCGTKLPESKRDTWFEELEKQGIHDPFNSDIPKEYESDQWYKK